MGRLRVGWTGSRDDAADAQRAVTPCTFRTAGVLRDYSAGTGFNPSAGPSGQQSDRQGLAGPGCPRLPPQDRHHRRGRANATRSALFVKLDSRGISTQIFQAHVPLPGGRDRDPSSPSSRWNSSTRASRGTSSQTRQLEGGHYVCARRQAREHRHRHLGGAATDDGRLLRGSTAMRPGPTYPTRHSKMGTTSKGSTRNNSRPTSKQLKNSCPAREGDQSSWACSSSTRSSS